MTEELPRIRRVRAGKAPNTLIVDWVGGGRDTVDLTGLIARVKGFASLEDADEFATVRPIDDGVAIGWDCGLDHSGSNLRLMAGEQRPMEAAEFGSWMCAMTISNREAAVLLDRSVSAIKNYRSGAAPISRPVATAVRAIWREPSVFLAHYRPTRRGRPRKSA